MSPENRSFSISGFGSGFADRQRDLFACLDAVEKEREDKKPDRPSSSSTNMDLCDSSLELNAESRGRGRRVPMKSFQGKESIFKRPEMPPPRRARHSIPDHQRNPHKWTKYTLGDVSPQDMSERSNTVTALSFLKELQARKDRESSMDVHTSLQKPVVFKSSRQRVEHHTDSQGHTSTESSTKTSEEGERPSFYRSKLVMPEYVVGQKQVKKKRLKDSNKCSNFNKVALDHLNDESD